MEKARKIGDWIDLELKEYYIDSVSGLDEIDKDHCSPGSIAYIITTGALYMLSEEKNWVLQ